MSHPPFITDLERIAALAHEKRDDNEAFRYYIELDERTDEELDIWVEAIAAPIIAAIDCTSCANCCRHLDVYLTEEDAKHLAEGSFIPLANLETRLIDQEQAQAAEEWGMFRNKPCYFLQGTRCSIYEYRPESCRTYPVFSPDFRWTLAELFDGVGLCPIIFNVVERLKLELQW